MHHSNDQGTVHDDEHSMNVTFEDDVGNDDNDNNDDNDDGDDGEDNIQDVQRKKVRKRMQYPAAWKRNQRKTLRNEGKEYVYKSKDYGIRIQTAKEMGAGCGILCRNECKQSITFENRQSIFTSFWKTGDIEKQREYIVRHVEVHNRNEGQKSKREKGQKLKYHLTVEGERKRVCKEMFKATLGISWRTIHTALEKTNVFGHVEKDARGKHDNHVNKLDGSISERIREHIRLFPAKEGHYVRQSSEKKYLDENLNISKMFRMYQEWCDENGYPKGKYYRYNEIFNQEFNISFFTPKKDQCGLCEKYKVADDVQKQDMRTIYEEHQQNKESVRVKKKADKREAVANEKMCCAVFDLQQQLPCPKVNVGFAFYKRQLNVYNLTIFELDSKQGHCYMWHEGVAARGANEIGSCLYKFLNEQSQNGIEKVTLYSDCCAGQNRNRFIPLMFMHVVHNSDSLNSITHRFLESGHSQNEGDSMHSVIEKKIRNEEIYVPEQYYDMASTAKVTGRRYIVNEMSDFFDFKSLALSNDLKLNWERNVDGEKVKWSKIKEIEVSREDQNSLFYKYSHGDDEPEKKLVVMANCPRRGNGFLRNVELHPVPGRQIPQTKLKDLMELRDKVVPPQYKEFYHNLNMAQNDEVLAEIQGDDDTASEMSDTM